MMNTECGAARRGAGCFLRFRVHEHPNFVQNDKLSFGAYNHQTKFSPHTWNFRLSDEEIIDPVLCAYD